MEIVLLIAVLAVAASGVYVAATFNTRAKEIFTPLTDGIENKVEAASEEARRQLQAISGKLQENSQLISHLEAASEELRQQMRAITDDLHRNSELVKQLDEQIDARQNQVGGDLAQLDHRVAELLESLARQGAGIAEIHRHVISRETQAGSSAERNSLLLAMREAEAHVDGKGWGGSPHLYVLTAQQDALVPTEHEPLPDVDLIEALADIRWPEDVVGCVLVTELVDLRLSSEEMASIDPVAAGQWASIHPDGRPARMAIGVHRSGERVCGLRFKGEYDLQVRTDVADDLATALLGTL